MLPLDGPAMQALLAHARDKRVEVTHNSNELTYQFEQELQQEEVAQLRAMNGGLRFDWALEHGIGPAPSATMMRVMKQPLESVSESGVVTRATWPPSARSSASRRRFMQERALTSAGTARTTAT